MRTTRWNQQRCVLAEGGAAARTGRRSPGERAAPGIRRPVRCAPPTEAVGVTDTAWERQREVRDALQTIVSDPQLGIAALSNAQMMSNLPKDLLPDAPRETRVLVTASEAGLANPLLDHMSQGIEAATAASPAASGLAARTPFTPEACDSIL